MDMKEIKDAAARHAARVAPVQGTVGLADEKAGADCLMLLAAVPDLLAEIERLDKFRTGDLIPHAQIEKELAYGGKCALEALAKAAAICDEDSAGGVGDKIRALAAQYMARGACLDAFKIDVEPDAAS